MRGLGAAIRDARGDEKLETIAKAAGMSTSALSRLERGERSEGLILLLRVLDAVGLELQVLPRRSGRRASPSPERVVEDALASDPQLYEHSREVILAAYRRARTNGREDRAAPPKKAAAGSS